MPWIDLHTHINMIKVDADEVIANAQKQGVERMVLVGTDPEDMFVVHDLAKKHAPTLFCTVGIHPHDTKLYTDEVENNLEAKLASKEVIGIGEIGLDYYYNHSPKEVQLAGFRRQMQLAAKHDMPVEIHTRDAEQDTIEVFKEYSGKVQGVLHCFTGSQWLANEALALGWDISLSGVCTFKNATALRETIKSLPVDRIHIETDAPFMAPTPHRGKENQPALLIHTAQMVSQILGIDETTLATQLKKNAKRLFPKLYWP